MSTPAGKKTSFRLGYVVELPYSLAVTLILILAYILTGAGLILFNFFTQAHQEVCRTVPSSRYDNETCSAGDLRFFETYYTKPLNSVSNEPAIGTFPWQLQGFGNHNNTIDYSILSMN
ncbi:hypothetical protein JCM8547_004115 [Rhodosporidiobolus lusitaniae]